jgi:hypothetical protein
MMGRHERLLALLLCCVAVPAARAADGSQADAGFLEFLGTWSGEEEDAFEEWLDFLEGLSDMAAGEPDNRPAGDGDSDHEAR